MEREWARHRPLVLRAGYRTQFRRFRASRARRFYEDFLVARSWPGGTRALRHFSWHGKEAGARLRPFLVEQYSDRLRRAERSSQQNQPRDFFAALRAGESLADRHSSSA